MRYLLFFLVIFSSQISRAQDWVNVSFQGYIRNYLTNENLFGATIYVVQNGKTIAKAVSESNGSYIVTGKIKTSIPFELMASRPKYVSKKVLVDMGTLQIKNVKNTTLQVVEELIFVLYEVRPNVDLSFAKSDYAEKFTWNQEKFIAFPEGKEANLNKQVEMAYDKAKNSTAKLSSADSTLQAQNDVSIEAQIKTTLTQADQLSKAGKYADALTEFNKAQSLVAKAYDQNKFSTYITSINSGMQTVNSKKDAEDLAFNSQLKIAKDKISSGRAGLALASNALNSFPMKSRANDPDVILLKDQISKLQQYYKDMDAAYKMVKSSKNNAGAMAALQTVFSTSTANSKFTLASEISQIKKSIDSLDNIINPKNNQVALNNTQIQNKTVLSAPGQKSPSNAKDAFDKLDKTKNSKTASRQEQMENGVNDVSYENSMNKKLNEARSEDDAKEVKKWQDEKDELTLVEDTLAELRQYQMEDARNQNEYAKYQLDSSSLKQTYSQATVLQQLQIDKEVYDKKESERNAEIQSRQKELVDEHIDESQVQRLEDIEKQRLRQADMEKAKNDVEASVYLTNTDSRMREEQRMYDQQKIASDKQVLKNKPNFLADANGNIYSNDTTYEEVYELKNDEGFVETVIIRRIVIDKDGFGVVYEQTKNEQGKSSYTRNGFSITEFEWQNESNGRSPFKK